MNKKVIWLGLSFCVCLGWGVPGVKSERGGIGLAPQPDDGVVWVKRYNGPAYGTDVAEAIAIDAAGNVFVTGGSLGSYGNWDYTTVKYAPGGTQKWAKKYGYNTSSSHTASNLDYAHAMALDASGNVYVTGESSDLHGFPEFATIKYDNNGYKIWTARSNGGGSGSISKAKAIILDSYKNVIVAGDTWLIMTEENTKHDFLTVKYDSGGHQIWQRRFDGTIHKDDLLVGVGVDSRQNIHVMGSSMEYTYTTGQFVKHSDYRLVKYDTNGTLLWTVHRNSQGTASDVPHAAKILRRSVGMFNATEIFLTGYSNTRATKHDFFTVKYDTDGGVRWTKTLESASGMTDIEAVGLAVDSAGNVYVTGSALCPPTKFITIKYDEHGNLKWTKTYDAGLGCNYATAIAVDGAGNVYVTGLSQSENLSSFDYATVKYDTDGNEKWVRRYNGTAFDYDWPRAIAVDKAGFVYVTGSSKGAGTKEDYLTIKYKAD